MGREEYESEFFIRRSEPEFVAYIDTTGGDVTFFDTDASDEFPFATPLDATYFTSRDEFEFTSSVGLSVAVLTAILTFARRVKTLWNDWQNFRAEELERLGIEVLPDEDADVGLPSFGAWFVAHEHDGTGPETP